MAADTCLDSPGSGGPEVEALRPPPSGPGVRAPSWAQAQEASPRGAPGTGRAEKPGAARGRGPGGGRGRRKADPGGLRLGWARAPGPFVSRGRRARGPSPVHSGRGGSRPAAAPSRGGRGRWGGCLGCGPATPAPLDRRLDRARARRAALRPPLRIKVVAAAGAAVGGGGAEEQGEVSGVLNASRVRLIIKLIKASI